MEKQKIVKMAIVSSYLSIITLKIQTLILQSKTENAWIDLNNKNKNNNNNSNNNKVQPYAAYQRLTLGLKTHID